LTPAADAPASTIRIAAPAKINLVLRILDRRPDGYHDIWSIMQTVGLYDRLTLRLAGGAGVRLTCSDAALPTDDRNLVVRAARAVLDRAGSRAGVEIELDKQIPMGGGLGGGSSDAAATLRALNRLLNLGWTLETLVEIAQPLGSDVPFFLYAPTALVTGRGGTVSTVPLHGARSIVLVNPGFGIETRGAYADLARSRTAVRPVSDALERLVAAGPVQWDDVVPLLENDFEPALTPSRPILGEMKAALRQAGAEGALLSGSGATVFGIFRDERTARDAAGRLAAARGWWTAAVPGTAEPSFG
jgi:4-diphosphocytidyl-2-C-methyl-D-erythritol kinase